MLKSCRRSVCGKPFEVKSNHKPERVYCSRLCKTKDGNERWRKNNPDKIRSIRNSFDFRRRGRKAGYYLKHRYGITAEQKYEMLNTQDGRCANVGCRTDNPGRSWQVDHDHATGKIRGILCWRCNAALGLVSDSTDKLTGLIQYLEQSHNVDLLSTDGRNTA